MEPRRIDLSLDPRFRNQPYGAAPFAAENARFLGRVYGWMTGGFCLTAAVAWNVSGNPALVQAIFGNRLLFWALIIGQLGAVFALSAAIDRMNEITATLRLLLYDGPIRTG